MKRSQIAGVDPPPPTITRAPALGCTGRAAGESATGWADALAESVMVETATNAMSGRRDRRTMKLRLDDSGKRAGEYGSGNSAARYRRRRGPLMTRANR